ncbi:LacI family DNA-binding transcriptional regulator [Microbacterium sp.]|uniref:LacI family DNA-binding transcriptional regulator n=1 Tax=Microbacterium sp. TaxID=51671 RepID=UPI003C7679DC
MAQRAGVSSTTVSHAINGKRYVSPELVERVRRAMADLSYVPSRSARNLATGQTQVVGLLVPDMANSFFAELAKGAEQTAIDLGFNVIMGNTGWDRERELLYLEMIRSRAVDGLIYAAGVAAPQGDVQSVVGDLPLILVDEQIADAAYPAVVSDNVSGGRLAAQHLLELGHRRALVLAAEEGLPSSTQRVEGFCASWIDGGGELVAARYGAFTEENGRAGILRYRSELAAGSVTAVFATNDLIALGAMEALSELGFTVPRDVSVVGFDDITVAHYVTPGLTTIRQSPQVLGEIAARRLINALQRREPVDGAVEMVPVDLVRRSSTAEASR